MKTIRISDWIVNYEETIIKRFPEWAIEEIINILPLWRRFFPREESWVQRKYGWPSMIVRVDCIINEGKLRIFEIEERPAGIGLNYRLNLGFKKEFDQLRRNWPWPEIIVVRSYQRTTGDDELWTEVVGIDQLLLSKEELLVLVRAEPEEKEFWGLGEISISTIKHKGMKEYGVPLGWWKKVETPEELPSWENGFVLKPLQGSKLKGIEIWPGEKNKKLWGRSTKAKILSSLQKGPCFCQPFYLPPQEKGYFWMFRIFFALNTASNGEWRCIGGLWNASPNLRIHGTPESIFGPIGLTK
jgi:hypothetical protein